VTGRRLAVGIALFLAALAAGRLRAAEKAGAAPTAVEEVRRGERLWQRIDRQGPYPELGLRSVFSYARALCQSRQHPERLQRLLALGIEAQDKDPKSRTYGNLRWYWRDAGVTDQNAVEFCAQDAAAIWLLDRQWMPSPAREDLHRWLATSAEGCLRHLPPPSYTNIALLNAGNLIVLGELLHRPEVTQEGSWRLDGLCRWTWAFGISEYDSPTYYGTDLDGLRFLEAHAHQDRCRRQTRALLELFWSDLAVNYFLPAGRLAGPHSRSYDYPGGRGQIDEHLARCGWLDGSTPPADGAWSPPERLRRICRDQYPRLVRQRWGIHPCQSRTSLLERDVALGCAGAGYGSQDVPLVVDLPGDRQAKRCYFIADGREDPYGRKRYETGPARHLKALHLAPFWAGAQRGRDALGLVAYRSQDVKSPPAINLQSHFVLRKDVEEWWLRGRRIELLPARPESPRRLEIAPGDPLVLRLGTAAVGVRLLWSRAEDGGPASAALVDDDGPGVVRLTVDHHRKLPSADRKAPSAEAGAAFWVRVGSGLTSADDFRGWRQRFERAADWHAEISPQRVWVAVPGETGPVAVETTAPFGRGGVRLDPPPPTGILELDGREIGRPILQAVEPVYSSLAGTRHAPRNAHPHAEREEYPGDPLRAIALPAQGNVSWEAESGLVFPGMIVAEDPKASGGSYVWQPADSRVQHLMGSIYWPIDVSRAGRYYLWARVWAPDDDHNSFSIAWLGDGGERPLAPWSLPLADFWRWEALHLTKAPQPTPLDLPAGASWLQIRVREKGTKIDRLMLTSDPQAKPQP
jgi:hypothetical protein